MTDLYTALNLNDKFNWGKKLFIVKIVFSLKSRIRNLEIANFSQQRKLLNLKKLSTALKIERQKKNSGICVFI